MELCADLPDPTHMNRGQFRGSHRPIKTFVRHNFDQVSAQAVTKLGVQGKIQKLSKYEKIIEIQQKSMKTLENQCSFLFCKIFQFEMELCADLPDPSHMNRGQFRGFHGPIKTFVRQNFDQASDQAVTKLGVQGKNAKVLKI